MTAPRFFRYGASASVRSVARSTTGRAPIGISGSGSCSRREYLLLAAGMLAGCAVLPEFGPDALAQWEERRRRLAAFSRFSFLGRLALRTSRDALNARIRWRQDGDEYRIRMGGLIGEAALELRGGTGGVELRAHDEVHRADSPEILLREHTGWSIPLQGLRYWVLGVTAPGTAVEALELDPEGRPEHFFQSGWRIVYRRYVSVPDIMLPERLDLERQGLEARLVVGRWNFEA